MFMGSRMLCSNGKTHETSPSTPEVSWESSFEENIPKNVGEPTTFGEKHEVKSPQRYNSIWTVTNWGKIKDFIKSVEQKAYERGLLAKVTEFAKEFPTYNESITQTGVEAERKRVNDILDGMIQIVNIEHDHLSYTGGACTACLINESNETVEQAKHLINNK